MKALVVIALLSLVFVASEARIVKKCDLAKQLRHYGLDGYLGVSLADWLCAVEHSSNFNTHPPMETTLEKGYGLFRFNNKFWCYDGAQPSENKCSIPCHKLIDDDLRDDILCAKKVLDMQGMIAWRIWDKKCRGKDLSSYVKNCPR